MCTCLASAYSWVPCSYYRMNSKLGDLFLIFDKLMQSLLTTIISDTDCVLYLIAHRIVIINIAIQFGDAGHELLSSSWLVWFTWQEMEAKHIHHSLVCSFFACIGIIGLRSITRLSLRVTIIPLPQEETLVSKQQRMYDNIIECTTIWLQTQLQYSMVVVVVMVANKSMTRRRRSGRNYSFHSKSVQIDCPSPCSVISDSCDQQRVVFLPHHHGTRVCPALLPIDLPCLNLCLWIKLPFGFVLCQKQNTHSNQATHPLPDRPTSSAH